jgi:hypothetical protein
MVDVNGPEEGQKEIEMLILTIAFLMFAGVCMVLRHQRRDKVLQNLITLIRLGSLQIASSVRIAPDRSGFARAEVIGSIPHGSKDDKFVFIAWLHPDTGAVDRLLFWIGGERYGERISRPAFPPIMKASRYYELLHKLDFYVQGRGFNPMLQTGQAA